MPPEIAGKWPFRPYFAAGNSRFVRPVSSPLHKKHIRLRIEVLQTTAAKPTVKLHLAAIRMLFDWLVVDQVLAVNPAHAVRGPKHVVRG